MSDDKRKMEPWQLIMILLLVVAFFGGIYFVNEAVSARLDGLDTALESRTNTLMLAIDRVDNKVESVKNAVQAQAQAPAPAPAPAAEEEGDAEGGGGEGKAEGGGAE